MSHFRNWFEAALVAAFLLVVSAVLEGPDEVQAAADMEAARTDAALQALRETSEAERVAWRVCRSFHAERAKLLQLETGEYVCRRMEGVL